MGITIKRLGAGAAAAAVGLAWATSTAGVPFAGAAGGGGASADVARARLVDPAGEVVGAVRFTDTGTRTVVHVRVALDPATAAYHGFHVHANSDPANGSGCVADPAAASTTWFVSADGHWKLDGQNHGAHLGDLVSVYVTADGTGSGRFVTDRFDVAGLAGRAVVLHAGADNFGNVPTGAAANQYTANSADATTLTANTGNAGARIACGVLALS